MCDRLPVGYKQMWVMKVRPAAKVRLARDFFTAYRIYDGKKLLGVGASEVRAWNDAAGSVNGEIDAMAFRQSMRRMRFGMSVWESGKLCMEEFLAQTNPQHKCFIGMPSL